MRNEEQQQRWHGGTLCVSSTASDYKTKSLTRMLPVDDRRCPQTPEEIAALVAANLSHFQSLPTHARQWRNIVRKALLSGHRVASLCESWCKVHIKLASHPDFHHLQQTVVFAYKSEMLWFKLLCEFNVNVAWRDKLTSVCSSP